MEVAFLIGSTFNVRKHLIVIVTGVSLTTTGSVLYHYIFSIAYGGFSGWHLGRLPNPHVKIVCNSILQLKESSYILSKLVSALHGSKS